MKAISVMSLGACPIFANSIIAKPIFNPLTVIGKQTLKVRPPLSKAVVKTELLPLPSLKCVFCYLVDLRQFIIAYRLIKIRC